MKKRLQTIVSAAAFAIAIGMAGCTTADFEDYNETLRNVADVKAGKISVSQSSNLQSVNLDLVGGKVVKNKNGESFVQFENVVYSQSNPFWNTKITLEKYKRELTPEGNEDSLEKSD